MARRWRKLQSKACKTGRGGGGEVGRRLLVHQQSPAPRAGAGTEGTHRAQGPLPAGPAEPLRASSPVACRCRPTTHSAGRRTSQ